MMSLSPKKKNETCERGLSMFMKFKALPKGQS